MQVFDGQSIKRDLKIAINFVITHFLFLDKQITTYSKDLVFYSKSFFFFKL